MRYSNFILFICICLNSQSLFGQIQRTFHWHFGNHAGLDFSQGTPQPILNSSIGAFEGCTGISDTCGNLLFYTNGGGSNGNFPLGRVWNANNNVMPNGDLPMPGGCNSSQQGSIIIPRPGTLNQYYLFTVDCLEFGTGGLRYSLIDMTLDGGLGDIDTLVKNVPLISPTNETLTATLHSNGTDYWVITHKSYSTEFYVYLVTNNGVQPPRILSVGGNSGNFGTSMKISPLRDKLSFGSFLFDFDATTGTISVTDTLTYGHFRSFSTSGRYLYTCHAVLRNIYQYDLASANIIASETIIGTYPAGTQVGDFQLAPNGNIYIPVRNSTHLAAIENANDSVPNFNMNSIYLGGNTSELGLPNFVDYYFVDTTSCVLTGMNKMKNSSEIKIFPNPSNGFFTISSPLCPKTIEVYNLEGELVLYKPIYNHNTLDVELKEDGLYFVRVKTKQNVFIQKVIIKK